MAKTVQVILGNQLFPAEHLPTPEHSVISMTEDLSLCTYVRHHKKKLVLFLAAMRNYADDLRARGYDVHYHALEDRDDASFEKKLAAVVGATNANRVRIFEIEDRFMERRVLDWAERQRIDLTIESSPMYRQRGFEVGMQPAQVVLSQQQVCHAVGGSCISRACVQNVG